MQTEPTYFHRTLLCSYTNCQLAEVKGCVNLENVKDTASTKIRETTILVKEQIP